MTDTGDRLRGRYSVIRFPGYYAVKEETGGDLDPYCFRTTSRDAAHRRCDELNQVWRDPNQKQHERIQRQRDGHPPKRRSEGVRQRNGFTGDQHVGCPGCQCDCHKSGSNWRIIYRIPEQRLREAVVTWIMSDETSITLDGPVTGTRALRREWIVSMKAVPKSAPTTVPHFIGEVPAQRSSSRGEVLVGAETAMSIVRLRRSELEALMDLYYRGSASKSVLTRCAVALRAGEDRPSDHTVTFSLSAGQRETLLEATTGRRVPGLGDLVPLLKQHRDQLPALVRPRRTSPPAVKRAKGKSKTARKSKSVWTVSGGLPSLGRRR
jgi:hypothetical protein